MNWTESLDNYCERLDPSFWAEPLNAASNLAFFIAALLVWRLIGAREWGVRLLLVILLAIGTGSFLFHTVANVATAAADSLPILMFILAYIYLATTRLLSLPLWAGAAAVVLYFPFSFGAAAGITTLFGPLNGSVPYVPVAILIAVYAGLLWRQNRPAALRLAGGVALLSLSLVFRSVDTALCASLPLGTHFIWHLLNGTLLGHMILTLHRHRTP